MHHHAHPARRRAHGHTQPRCARDATAMRERTMRRENTLGRRLSLASGQTRKTLTRRRRGLFNVMLRPRSIEHRARHGEDFSRALRARMYERAFEASAISRQAQSTLREPAERLRSRACSGRLRKISRPFESAPARERERETLCWRSRF